jgi:peptidoglycan hydrolase-like amidase
VYRGVRAETGPGSKAVKATAGEGLYDGDALAYSYYFSSCGGHTRSSSESAGWGRSSYLTGRFDSPGSSAPWKTPWELERWLKDEPDAYCNIPELVGSTEFRWLRIVPRDVLERKLGRRYRLGRQAWNLDSMVDQQRVGHAIKYLS